MSEETTKTTGRSIYVDDQYLKNHVEYEAMMVCATCFEIYGPWHYREKAMETIPDENFFQPCDCTTQKMEAKYPTSFDFNKVAELCYCCGQEVLPSGAKWSVWFCDECKKRIVQFNTRYQQKIIPIGRHSLMAGYSLGAKDAHDPETIETFLKNYDNLVSRIGCLTEWKKFIHAENLKHLGYFNNTLLKDYLTQARELPEKSIYFFLLTGFFEQALRKRQSS